MAINLFSILLQMLLSFHPVGGDTPNGESISCSFCLYHTSYLLDKAAALPDLELSGLFPNHLSSSLQSKKLTYYRKNTVTKHALNPSH